MVVTRPIPPTVGLYSIGVRSIELEDLLLLAAAEQVPFLHVRGGPRGFDLASRDDATLDRWAHCARSSTPITMVTADLDLADFATPDPDARRRAHAELDRLGHAAAMLGARAIRLLARQMLDPLRWTGLSMPDLVARYGLTTLVELHDPAWFAAHTAASLAEYLNRTPRIALLMDTAQVHDAWLRSGNPDSVSGTVSMLVPYTRVVHLSDNGDGLTGAGHRIVAQSFKRASHDSPVEIAFEWTGADRSPQGCLARYHSTVDWWHASLQDNR